jgi:rod shape-determining protein MreB and related proteins
MTTAALEKPSSPAPQTSIPAPGLPPHRPRPRHQQVLRPRRAAGSGDITVSKVVPSVVGYVKDGIVDGIITGNARILYGEDALRQMLHVELAAPLAEGVIARPDAARDFMQHIRHLADPVGPRRDPRRRGRPGKRRRAGSRVHPARGCRASSLASCSVPEPFLAALGYRDDSRVKQPGYVDPVVNSLFIDIGGGTSDLCLVQGYFPTRDDQISIPFAGDAIDALIFEELDRTYPNNGLSRTTVREIKEAHAYVGPSRKPLEVKVVIGGKSRTLELGDAIGQRLQRPDRPDLSRADGPD